MPDQNSIPWSQQLQQATARAEEDLRRVVTYINDEVVPDIRRNGSEALRAAAVELQKLAQRMDDTRTRTPGSTGSKGTPQP
ncbi:MAG: hypothetical protein M3O02_10575 [Acidobacteriota bacterium]|nr:hypothetical protein [Acidobacteriota bacterium]